MKSLVIAVAMAVAVAGCAANPTSSPQPESGDKQWITNQVRRVADPVYQVVCWENWHGGLECFRESDLEKR